MPTGRPWVDDRDTAYGVLAHEADRAVQVVLGGHGDQVIAEGEGHGGLFGATDLGEQPHHPAQAVPSAVLRALSMTKRERERARAVPLGVGDAMGLTPEQDALAKQLLRLITANVTDG